MKNSSVLTFLGIILAIINAALPLIAFADPGCLKVIQGQAINEKLAKTLPADCQAFRKNYLKGLHLLSEDPKKFSHELAKQISAKKSFEPPYDALLISVFPQTVTDELKSAIHARAQMETAKKFKYKYAVAVEERLEKGECSSLFSEAAYDEVCRAKDLAYVRIEKLQNLKSGLK